MPANRVYEQASELEPAFRAADLPPRPADRAVLLVENYDGRDEVVGPVVAYTN